jgi:hypothetical protein
MEAPMAGRVRLGILGIGLLVVGVFVGTFFQPSTQAQTTPSGRFQIVLNPQVRADTFLLDTATGRTWVPTKFSDLEGDPVIWDIQTRVDTSAEFMAWFKTQTKKAK